MARVCKNDSGGPHKFKNKWTSFLKSRLNCSVPGNMPFEFREIQSTASQMVDLGDGDKLVYGVFTTPDNAIAGSAVCSFRLSDIRHSFDEGPFKGQAGANANWLPVPNPPSPRPGSCAANSRELDDAGLNFIKRHSLMDRAVSNAGADPLLVRTSVKERMTVIAVDPRCVSGLSILPINLSPFIMSITLLSPSGSALPPVKFTTSSTSAQRGGRSSSSSPPSARTRSTPSTPRSPS